MRPLRTYLLRLLVTEHLLAISMAILLPSAIAQTAIPPKPKLVVGIVVDQFRYDYLTRFRADYHQGLDRLLREGAVFTNALYQQVPTVTAVGHSIFMSGAMPSVSGIISNSWYDRNEGQVVTSVCDWDEKTVGGHQEEQGPKCTDSDPASPRRLLTSTVGDELKFAHPNSRVIGISIKARGAIMPSGHAANAAFWFDDVSGNFVSSTYYFESLPSYAAAFNEKKLPDSYVTRKWENFPKWSFKAPANSKRPYAMLPASPWGNELIEDFAEQAIIGEKLGTRSDTDLLTVSFSSNDYVGHQVGPDAPEVRDMSIRTDQLIGKLFSFLDQQIGMNNVVVVLSADHGVAPVPEHQQEIHALGGRMYADIEDAVRQALTQHFGPADWFMPGGGETGLYLNRNAIDQLQAKTGKQLSDYEIYQVARDVLINTPQLHVVRVYTRDQLDSGVTGDFIAEAETNGYFPRRSGDINMVYEPFFIPGTEGTSHFSPYAYDRHVPLIFMGPGIKPGRRNETISPTDIAPTLATLLDIQMPSGSEGRVLTTILQQP